VGSPFFGRKGGGPRPPLILTQLDLWITRKQNQVFSKVFIAPLTIFSRTGGIEKIKCNAPSQLLYIRNYEHFFLVHGAVKIDTFLYGSCKYGNPGDWWSTEPGIIRTEPHIFSEQKKPNRTKPLLHRQLAYLFFETVFLHKKTV
jgi:hypothetical protein